MKDPPGTGDPDAADHARPAGRLDSWKEIAAYFRRDVRTVRRWEGNEGLPVHRHLHRARGSVYAFQEELDQWLTRRSASQQSRSDAHPLPRTGLIGAVAGALVLGLAAGAVALYGLSRQSTAAAPGAVHEPDVLAKPALWHWPPDPQVRELFLVARHHLGRRDGFRQRALECLEEVTRRAPDFADAHALLGEAYLRRAIVDRAHRTDIWPQAEAAVRRALALDGGLALGHAVLGRILLIRDWNWSGAEAEFLRAINLDPSSADARSAYALYLRSAGRVEEAIVQRHRARQADVLNPQLWVFLGDEYLFARRPQDAVSAYLGALELERNYRPALAGLADALERAGRDEWTAWEMQLLTLSGRSDVAARLDQVRQRDGHVAAGRWRDHRNLIEYEREPDRHLWDLAYTHARLNQRDAAIHFLELAYERREPGLLQARVDPDVDTLRGDRRFQELLRRVGPAR